MIRELARRRGESRTAAGEPRRRRRLTHLGVAIFALASLLTHGGCATAPSQVLARQRVYDPSEYAPYEGRGTSELSGTAFAKGREGEVIYAADDTVYLFPATRYTEEWWRQTLLAGRYLTDPDPRSLAFMRTIVADERGRFRFRSLPAGDYYLVCIVTWERDGPGTILQVVNLGKRVHLGSNESASVVLEPLSRHRALIDPPPLGADVK